MGKIALAVHGGCGVMAKLDLTQADWIEARGDLALALQAGWSQLAAGGSALDAVQSAVVVMENSPHFNAGYGAALNENSVHELDAAVMDGRDLRAGAVAGAQALRSPILGARAVMERGDAVMLVGPAADEFGRNAGLQMVPNSFFTTPKRVKALQSMKAHVLAGTAAAASEAEKHGTVGAVALDDHGHLAAATSTGGYTNKPQGRVGDTPIIGAGTYARDGVCAISGTGKGEYFMRHVLGHEIASRMAYLNETLEQASARLIHQDLAGYGIGAGLVGVAADGTIVAPYNTDGMFRGWVTPEGKIFVASHDTVFPYPNPWRC